MARRKPAGIDKERNYVIVTLCIQCLISAASGTANDANKLLSLVYVTQSEL